MCTPNSMWCINIVKKPYKKIVWTVNFQGFISRKWKIVCADALVRIASYLVVPFLRRSMQKWMLQAFRKIVSIFFFLWRYFRFDCDLFHYIIWWPHWKILLYQENETGIYTLMENEGYIMNETFWPFHDIISRYSKVLYFS